MPETRRVIRRPRQAEEYEEEAPRRRRQRDDNGRDDDSDLVVGSVATGWGGYAKTKANAPSKWTKLYKVPDEEQLILFLQDGPYVSYNNHWCDWMPNGHKLSYVCLRPDDCPICDIGDDPSSRIRFNILDMAYEEPLLTTLECGITVTDNIAKFQPIEGQYFAICMGGGKNKKGRRTQIRPIKTRDLEEDWDTKPLTESQIRSFDKKLWDASSVERSTKAQLEEVAEAHNQ